MMARAVLALARLYLLAAHPVLTFDFVRKLGYWPDPAWPRRYLDRLLWRKLLDRTPRLAAVSDKLAAKRIAGALRPDVPAARVLWSGDDPDAIPAALIAGDAVVKTNHGCAHNIFVALGAPPRDEIVRRARRWLSKPYGRRTGQWAYWPVPRRVFVEERLTLGGVGLPTDIKVHTFPGGICHVWVDDKHGRRSRTYDANGLPLDCRDTAYRDDGHELPDSPALGALVRDAIDLAPGFLGDLDYVRVDFLVCGGRLYFGEYTVYPGAGFDRFYDAGLMARADALWDLRASGFLRGSHRGVVRLYAEALRAAIDAERGAGKRPLG
jgi:hypothetical protein